MQHLNWLFCLQRAQFWAAGSEAVFIMKLPINAVPHSAIRRFLKEVFALVNSALYFYLRIPEYEIVWSPMSKHGACWLQKITITHCLYISKIS